MLKLSESPKIVRRENDDRRTSGGGGGINDINIRFQKHLNQFSMEEDLYDKIPSYMTAFSHGSTVPINDQNEILNTMIANSGDGLKRNLYSWPRSIDKSYNNESDDEYCRLPAYTMDFSQSLLYDDDFEGRVPALKTIMQCTTLRTKQNRKKPLKISKESTDFRKVVFIGNLPPLWANPNNKLEAIIREEIKPSVFENLIRIDVKSRFHNHLDSYAFIHFTGHESAYVTLNFFQNHEIYKQCNASFAGRDEYCSGKKYSDIDGFPSLLEKIRY